MINPIKSFTSIKKTTIYLRPSMYIPRNNILNKTSTQKCRELPLKTKLQIRGRKIAWIIEEDTPFQSLAKSGRQSNRAIVI